MWQSICFLSKCFTVNRFVIRIQDADYSSLGSAGIAAFSGNVCVCQGFLVELLDVLSVRVCGWNSIKCWVLSWVIFPVKLWNIVWFWFHVRMCCLSLSSVTETEECLCFGLLVGQEKWFWSEFVISSFHFFNFFLHFIVQTFKCLVVKIISRLNKNVNDC